LRNAYACIHYSHLSNRFILIVHLILPEIWKWYELGCG
jgi:hypothetical protein